MNKVGFAVDLGTTTIDYCLLDMNSSSVISQASFQNPQSLYGSDVITRIMTITRDSAYANVLKEQVLIALTSQFMDMLVANQYEAADVSRICICGNTTMISILLGLDVEGIGKAPFTTKLAASVTVMAKQLFGPDTLFDCSIYLSGCASAFIGGDVLSGIYYLKHQYKNEAFTNRNCLFIDLGTNGEIVLYTKDNRYFGAATACGPAFEGCTRRQKVYGATLIDAIVMCMCAGKILPNGSFALDAIDSLTVNGIVLTTEIMHNILLAKAAIAAGIETICEHAGIRLSHLDTIYLAGGFGFHLDISNAIRIGLLPEIFNERIIIVGNSSLGGAKLLLKEQAAKSFYDFSIETLNFATISSYQDKFVQNMYFRCEC